MTNHSPFISVLTPTWNRADYLKQVWDGLISQSFKDFEWVVSDDGSSDQTTKVVADLAARSPFPVTLITASCRVGKSKIDNVAVTNANGAFIIWCDSDDLLLPSALEVLVDTWKSIPQQERGAYCGVTALCKTHETILGNKFYGPCEVLDMPWNEIYLKLNSDLVIFTRAELLKSSPFPEVDFLTPESSVWNKIGIMKTRFVPFVLQQKSYRERNCLSFNGTMAYSRGYAHSIAITKPYVWALFSRKERLRKRFNFSRYCRHGEISFIEAVKLWNASPPEIVLFLFLMPFSELIALADKAQGKVQRTHRDFNVAISLVKFDVKRFNYT